MARPVRGAHPDRRAGADLFAWPCGAAARRGSALRQIGAKLDALSGPCPRL